MRKPGRFERRLLIALVLFSLIPSLLLVGVGTLVLREAVSLQTTPAGWERLADSGQELLERAEASGDPQLQAAAARHRDELSASVQQAQRWGYLNRRVLDVLPWAALFFLLLLGFLAVRSARRMAGELARPIRELVRWSGLIARGESLPSDDGSGQAAGGELATLQSSFRTMADELDASRTRAVETERIRASVALARGVAHELKNALTPLTLAVATLRRQGGGKLSDEPLDVIEAESERLEELARAFSQFGRPPTGERSPIDVRELLEYLARTRLPPQIRVTLDADGEVPPVQGHYDALSRALANLLLNASEAMGVGGGAITISVGAAGAGEIEVRIADSGPGLTPDALERLWDPDFTTKARGTGLGLALVRQTMAAHGGRVDARNLPAGGAEFHIVLPADEALEPARAIGGASP